MCLGCIIKHNTMISLRDTDGMSMAQLEAWALPTLRLADDPEAKTIVLDLRKAVVDEWCLATGALVAEDVRSNIDNVRARVIGIATVANTDFGSALDDMAAKGMFNVQQGHA